MEAPVADAKTVSVLLIFENKESAAIIADVLQGVPSRRFTVTSITPDQVESFLQEGEASVDVAVVDVSPPAEPGLAVVSSVNRLVPSLPIVTWSDNGEDDLDDEALSRGAQDHLIGSDTSSDGMVRALLRAIQRTRMEKATVTASVSSVHMAAVDLLNRLSLGIIMVDRDARVRLVNRRAELLLEERDGLSVDRSGVIRANTAEQTKILHDLIRACAQEGIMEDRDRNYGIALNRPSEKPPLSVLTAPVGAQKPGAVLFVSDPEQPLEIRPGILVSLYALTPAEERLVFGLVAGKQIEDLSDELGTSAHTLRSRQLRITLFHGHGLPSQRVQGRSRQSTSYHDHPADFYC